MTITYQVRERVTIKNVENKLGLYTNNKCRALLPSNKELSKCINRLQKNLESFEELSQSIKPEDKINLLILIASLEKSGLLRIGIANNSKTLLSLEPLSHCFERKELIQGKPVRLSRFVKIYRQDDALTLEIPTGNSKVKLHDHRLGSIICLLNNPCSYSEILNQFPDDLTAYTDEILMMLLSSNIIGHVNGDGHIDTDKKFDLHNWNESDLAFHSQSRLELGRLNLAERIKSNNTPSLLAEFDNNSKTISLVRPNKQLIGKDFLSVIEKRRSIRSYSEDPIDIGQISTLLWYSLRIQKQFKSTIKDKNGDDLHYEAAFRPVPSGGAVHEIRVVLCVRRCKGLDAGLYEYDPNMHQLLFINSYTPKAKKLMDEASMTAKLNRPSDLLITMVARYDRISWKYNQLTYSLILKNVGAIYQQLYLVSTAIGLAPCALGWGNSLTFEEATKINPYRDIAVGEFIIGRIPNEQT